MPVCLCLCTFIEIRKGTKNLDLVLCTVVYIGLGKTSVTIWTIGSLENWGNHWGKWTILRSFRATLVTLPDCIGGVTWQHISSDASTLSFCLPSMIFTIILVRFHSLVEADDVAAWAPHLNLLLAQHLQTNLYQVMMVMMMMIVIMMLWPSLGVGTSGWLFRVRKVAILAFTRKFTFSLILIFNTQELVEQLLLRLDLAVSGIIINFWKDCEFSRIQLRHLFALPSGNLCLLSLDPRWDLKIFVCLKSDNKF